jgi:hypothetical protein
MLLGGQPLLAQSSREAVVAQFETQYGANPLLASGLVYVPLQAGAEGHPFYQDQSWQPGEVFLKGEHFPNLELRYELVTGQLLLHTDLPGGAQAAIVLNPQLVDSFRLADQLFVQAQLTGLPDPAASYYSRGYAGDMVLYLGYSKRFLSQYSALTPAGKYAQLATEYLLLQDGVAYPIPNRSALLRHFAPIKKDLRRYLRTHRLRYQQASLSEWNALMKFCDERM